MSQGYTKGTPIDTDTTLSANSDALVPSQKAIKTYVNLTRITSLNGDSTTAQTLDIQFGIGESIPYIIDDSAGGHTIMLPYVDGGRDGVLSSTDWITFNSKANTASPAFTGTPTAPTATAGTNTTQIATTAFVTNAVSGGGLTFNQVQRIAFLKI